ncbi:MAG: hypothetical protein OEM51_11985, partial [Gammaproteobacteria bacterium]|nr:hypothetical protein [Gammaproteobacteria bacterium]
PFFPCLFQVLVADSELFVGPIADLTSYRAKKLRRANCVTFFGLTCPMRIIRIRCVAGDTVAFGVF